MKASVIHEFGDVDVFSYEDVQTPKPKPGHVLIKVLAAGINRIDHYLREGSYIRDLSMPHILGADAVGEVAELGEGVIGFEIGERVIPLSGFPTEESDYKYQPLSAAPSFSLLGLGTPGAYAQYLEVPARWVLKDRSGLSPELAATLPMVVATGVRVVKVVGEVKPGDKVLIHAGGSGAGSLQIQVAKALGAEVATTVRNDKKGELAKSLGADLVINMRKEDFLERVQQWTGEKGVDVVIDNLGGDLFAKTVAAARRQGIVVAIGFVQGTRATFDIRDFFFNQKQIRGSLMGGIEDIQWGMEQVRLGKIKPVLDRSLPLSQAAEAHRLIANNEVTGNIVLLPWADNN